MLRFRIIVICISLVVIVSSIHYQAYASESKVTKGQLTASCGIIPFGGGEVGSFDLEVRPLKERIGNKSNEFIESLIINMKEAPTKGDYLVGFIHVGGWPHNMNEALVKVEEYRDNGRVIIVSKQVMPFFNTVLFVAQRDPDRADRYWPAIDMIGTAHLVPPIESLPESNKFEYKNATIIHTLDTEKNEYAIGEKIELKPNIVNIGSENLTITHRRPLFWISTYTLVGEILSFNPSAEDVGIEATLSPLVPYDYTWSLYPNRTTYDIRFCNPGEYKIVSYAEFVVREQIDESHTFSKDVRVYAEPVTIKVIPTESEKKIRLGDQLGTSSLSLYLSDYWISRAEVLGVNGSFYDLKTDAEFADFEIKIAGPLPENSLIFSETITVKNGGNFSLPIEISDTMEPAKYNITIFTTNSTVTNLYSLTSFIVRGPAFVPMDIKYIGPGSTERERFIYTDTNSVMFIDTNSSRYGWYASAETKTIQITIVGKEGTRGYMNLVIPREVMHGIEEVKIVPRAYSEYSIDTNSTHTTITMNYPHNEKETLIIIKSAFMVPEFPVNLMVITTLGLIGALIVVRINVNRVFLR